MFFLLGFHDKVRLLAFLNNALEDDFFEFGFVHRSAAVRAVRLPPICFVEL